MTLKEKFSALLPFYNVNDNNNKSIQCEKIADDYAIQFAEWIDKNHKSISLEIYSNKKKVLEIFKKEKGL
jgi:hypothetical protein